MSNRLHAFSTDELSALISSLDIAASVEPLVPEAGRIRQQLIEELKERGLAGSTSKPECRDHGA